MGVMPSTRRVVEHISTTLQQDSFVRTRMGWPSPRHAMSSTRQLGGGADATSNIALVGKKEGRGKGGGPEEGTMIESSMIVPSGLQPGEKFDK
jgi:hypothetical protein